MKIPTEDDINEDALDKDFQQLELECKVEGQRPKSKLESCEEELDVSYTCSHLLLLTCFYVSMFAYMNQVQKYIPTNNVRKEGCVRIGVKHRGWPDGQESHVINAVGGSTKVVGGCMQSEPW